MATLKKPKKLNKQKAVAAALGLARQAVEFPATRLWLDFDEEADVLYISLKRPQRATETVDLEEEGILLDYRDKELVGITVLDVSKR
jgi:uncharacterized protein YuzE